MTRLCTIVGPNKDTLSGKLRVLHIDQRLDKNSVPWVDQRMHCLYISMSIVRSNSIRELFLLSVRLCQNLSQAFHKLVGVARARLGRCRSSSPTQASTLTIAKDGCFVMLENKNELTDWIYAFF